MRAERILVETDDRDNLVDLPKLPPNRRLEVIFLLLDDSEVSDRTRTPPERLRGSITTKADLLEPAVSDAEWEASLDRTARQIAGDPESFE